eukprot:jgi/Ulvmu1/3830/UM018_0042.1
MIKSPQRLRAGGVRVPAGIRARQASTDRPDVGFVKNSPSWRIEHPARQSTAVWAQSSDDPVAVQDVELFAGQPGRPVLFYLPGADGTAGGIAPHLRSLRAHGFGVRCAVIPSTNRSGWLQLTDAVAPMLARATQASGQGVIIIAESFGACLALRLALKCPQHLSHLVLINSATAFNAAMAGLPALLGQTGLLAAFPEPLFKVSQSILLPLLVNPVRADPNAGDVFRTMMNMSQTSTGSLVASLDDPSASTIGKSSPLPSTSLTRPSLPGPPQPFQLAPHAPAAAASFRVQLMRGGNLTDSRLAQIRVNTVVVSSARDRLFPSMTEGARLQRVIPGARRVILPESGHAPMLEKGFSLLDLLCRTQVAVAMPTERMNRAGQPSVNGSDSSGSTRKARQAGSAFQDRAVTSMTASNASVAERPVQGVGHARDVSAAAAGLQGISHNRSNGAAAVTADSPTSSQAYTGITRSPPPAGVSAVQQQPLNVGVLNDSLEDGFESFRAWRDIISPVLLGLENLPPRRPGNTAGLTQPAARPLLFVGNHTLFGMYDMPLLFMEMYARGFELTGLADPDHWKTPLGPFFETFGAVPATPLSAFRALRDGKSVLLFPGGGREVSKNRAEQYKLLWPRTGDFARLAAATNATIVPFSAVGGDDAFDIAMDPADILAHPVLAPLATAAVDRLMREGRDPAEVVWPITRLPGSGMPSPLPVANFGRVYFKIGEPVDMAEVDKRDRAACRDAAATARSRVEAGIQELLEVREADPERGVWGRAQRRAMEAVNLASRL